MKRFVDQIEDLVDDVLNQIDDGLCDIRCSCDSGDYSMKDIISMVDELRNKIR